MLDWRVGIDWLTAVVLEFVWFGLHVCNLLVCLQLLLYLSVHVHAYLARFDWFIIFIKCTDVNIDGSSCSFGL